MSSSSDYFTFISCLYSATNEYGSSGGGVGGSKVYTACFLLGSAELHRQLLDQCSFCFSNSKVLIEIEDKQEIEKNNQHLG